MSSLLRVFSSFGVVIFFFVCLFYFSFFFVCVFHVHVGCVLWLVFVSYLLCVKYNVFLRGS